MREDISIIIPLFNKEKFVLCTLKSVTSQIFDSWVCYIIDDGSTDRSVELVKEYIKKDDRFKLIRRNAKIYTKGASSCRNIGLSMARGQYIQYLDADDVISSNKLALQFEELEFNRAFDIATCSWGRFSDNEETQIYEDLESYRDFDSLPEFLNALGESRGYFPLHTYLFRKELLQKAGIWNEFLSINDDGEYLARIFCLSKGVKFCFQALALYRWTTVSNLSSFSNSEEVKKMILSLQHTEALLKINYGKSVEKYLLSRKRGVHINLSRTHPELINHFFDFFKDQKPRKLSQNTLRMLKTFKKIFALKS